MNTIIIVKVRERIINLSYSEAKQLLRKLDSAIRDTDEYKQEVKETQQYLDEFEKSNRQFPDELFKPKETPIACDNCGGSFEDEQNGSGRLVCNGCEGYILK